MLVNKDVPRAAPLVSGDTAFQHFRNFSAISVNYTITSIMKDTQKVDRFINKNAVPFSLSGFKLALYRIL